MGRCVTSGTPPSSFIRGIAAKKGKNNTDYTDQGARITRKEFEQYFFVGRPVFVQSVIDCFLCNPCALICVIRVILAYSTCRLPPDGVNWQCPIPRRRANAIALARHVRYGALRVQRPSSTFRIFRSEESGRTHRFSEPAGITTLSVHCRDMEKSLAGRSA